MYANVPLIGLLLISKMKNCGEEKGANLMCYGKVKYKMLNCFLPISIYHIMHDMISVNLLSLHKTWVYTFFHMCCRSDVTACIIRFM